MYHVLVTVPLIKVTRVPGNIGSDGYSGGYACKFQISSNCYNGGSDSMCYIILGEGILVIQTFQAQFYVDS